jgi:4-amino-4-deoxy-L-arabinose transferase-like glycosyltransferase
VIRHATEDPGPAAQGDTRRFGVGLALILLGAATARGLYLAETLGDPLLRDLLILDSRSYDALARVIVAGGWRAGDEVYALGPLYPYALAALRGLVGDGTGFVYAIQQLLGLGSVALTALIARRCFGTGAALVAAGLVAFYGAMALLEVKVMASTLATFASLASLQLLLVARDRRWRVGALLPGAVLGLACLARPNTLLFLPLAALWLAWDPSCLRQPGRGFSADRVPAVLALLAGALLTIAPATLRNHAVADEWVLISSQGGLTFYQANNELAQGLYTRLPGFHGTPADLRQQARATAERQLGRPLGTSEVSRYWTGRGLAWLAADPLGGLVLLGSKLHHWLGNDELSTEYVLPVERGLTPRLWLMPVPFAAILALALLGLLHANLRRPELALLGLFAGANLASVLVFYFSSRYRLPAVPVLAVFAGGGAVAAVAQWQRSRLRFAAQGAAALLLGTYSLYSWTDPLHAQGGEQLYNYGKVYHQRGLYEAAVEKYQAALPAFEGRWALHFDLGNAYQLLGEPENALDEYEAALRIAPGQPAVSQQADRMRRRLAKKR